MLSLQKRLPMNLAIKIIIFLSFTLPISVFADNTLTLQSPAFATPSLDFKNQLQNLTKVYLPLKDALVQTDASAAQNTAKAFLDSLAQIPTNTLSDSTAQYWAAQQQIISEAATNIANTDNIDAQRQHFQTLSNALIHALQTFEVATDTYYIQHCPMAFDNTGADWISDEAAILNPYFGDMMLRCGYVKSGGKE